MLSRVHSSRRLFLYVSINASSRPLTPNPPYVCGVYAAQSNQHQYLEACPIRVKSGKAQNEQKISA